MLRFFDASALVKRYVREPESASVRRWLAAHPAAVSRLSEVEVASALARLARTNAMAKAQRDRAVATLMKDITAWHVVELTADVSQLARELMMRHPLRTGDAVQLASALHVQQILMAPLTAFVAYDERLNQAAAAEGLTVVG